MNKSVFSYRNSALCVEALPLLELTETIDTPFFCTSVKQLQHNLRGFAAPLGRSHLNVAFALQGNPALAVIRAFAESGAMVAASSSGDLERSLESDVLPDNILFSGVGKSRDDMITALIAGVSCLVVDSPAALQMVSRAAFVLDRPAPVCLRLSEAGGAMDWNALSASLSLALSSDSLSLRGLAVTTDGAALRSGGFAQSCRDMALLAGLVRAQGISLERLVISCEAPLSLDGANRELWDALVLAVETHLAPLGLRLTLELGACLSQNASLLITRIAQIRRSADAFVYVLDVGLQEPQAGRAAQEILPLREAGGSLVPVQCLESQGFSKIGPRLHLPVCQHGDAVALFQPDGVNQLNVVSGADRAFLPELLVSGALFSMIRRRIPVAEQMAWETIPDWMEAIDAA